MELHIEPSPSFAASMVPKFQSPQDNAIDKQVSTERGQTAKFKFAGEKHNKEKIKLDLIIISNEVFCSLYMNKQINNKPKGTL